MKPDHPGIYWVKEKFWIDRTAGETENEWRIAEWTDDDGWLFIGDECGLGNEHIVAIGPEVTPPVN